ncbi:MAG: hypothetical protein LBI12_05630, partial [Treponema sp.]|nr:hypothetical protein [Treponema sp.]
MEKTHNSPNEAFHFKRQRLNNLFTEAVKFPLIVVNAGTGYGKTCAASDFLKEYQPTTLWIQLSERDNVGARLWENFAHSAAQVNVPFAKAIRELGFPDTKEKTNKYMALAYSHLEIKPRVIVLDDFHCINDSSVIRFLEDCLVIKLPPGTSVILLSRSTPHVNFARFISRDLMFNITENDLRFTENELTQYFRSLDITPQLEHMYEIMQDTEGWAFAINLIARSYQKAPGYSGYVRNAVKTSIFRLMETEIWENTSKQLQTFLIRLSLISHLSFDLVESLAGKNTSLITELQKQNAYVYIDNYINAYLIHPLFLEFLAEKQHLLSKKQKFDTYKTAGNWCSENGFKIDALSCFEKTEDYKSIVQILYELPTQIPRDIAKYASPILDNAPKQMFKTVHLLAAMHISTYMGQGLWNKAVELSKYYEGKFLKLPKSNAFRNISLSNIYHCWAFLRILLCITDDCYDFDIYFEKFFRYSPQPFDFKRAYNKGPGPWLNAAGVSRKGAPQDFIEALARSTALFSKHFNGFKTGDEDLARGELKFYEGEIRAAETFFIGAYKQAQETRHFEVMHRSLFYIMRLAIVQGNFQKADQALKDMKTHLDESDYINRFINYDIAQCWYCCIMGMPEKTPGWLTDSFSPYSHAAFIENFGNQMKALYCYVTRNYPPILSYIQEMKQRESYLYGRTEMLAMEACIYYKMDEKQKALNTLKIAYETASPNNLLMSFIELGKDMRTLTTFALKEQGRKNGIACGIPEAWLETVNLKSASYAKRQAHIVTIYRQTNSIANLIISAREREVLTDLSHG